MAGAFVYLDPLRQGLCLHKPASNSYSLTLLLSLVDKRQKLTMTILKPIFTVLLFSFLITASVAQNRFNSRLFYVKPPLFNSKSKVNGLHLSRFDVSVALPVDDRSRFYGEVVYKRVKAHPVTEFFQSPIMVEIQNKIKSDVKRFENGRAGTAPRNRIALAPTVEVFYPRVKFIRGKSFAKVRLAVTATLNDSLLIRNTYESFYITDGSDNEFEGSLLMSVEEGTNVTIGMALRRTLDQFYADLKEALTRSDKMVITGRVTNQKTGAGLRATVLLKSDSAYSATTAPDGRFRLRIPFSAHFNLQVQAGDFVTLSARFDPLPTWKVVEKNFQLQPSKVGTVVSLKNVLFYMGTTDLLDESYHELDGIVAFMKGNPKVKIELDGHTDNQGDPKKDLILSQDRVDKIKSYLVSKGIAARRLTGKGFGSTRPIASNGNEAGRKLNRRVEFVILKN